MANIGGPKGPSDPKPGKVLPFQKREIKAEAPEIKAEKPSHTSGPHAPVIFDPAAAKGTVVPDAPSEQAAGAQVRARLAAMGQLPIKRTEVGKVKDTPLGKIFEGSLT